jgi:Rad3-related DNA helicase
MDQRRLQKRLEEILSGEGLLAKVLDAYEPRPQQLTMGHEVLESLLRGRFLIVEAPTGVGKTMAYLVPAALYARRKRRPVVVSSYTRTLQDQILKLEAPRLRRLIHPDLQVAVLKGRANYLCMRRWDLFVAEEGSTSDGSWVVDRLEGWVRVTETGDFAAAPDLGRRGARLLARIGGDPRFCRSKLCRADSGCFHKRARREARHADIVVINHSLLLSDALTGNILPEHDALIVDEAHLLPEAALGPLSTTIAQRAFEDRLRLMGGSGEPGVSDRIRRGLRQLPSKVASRNLTRELRTFEERARETVREVRAFYTSLRANPAVPAVGQRRRYGERDIANGLLPAETEHFLSTSQVLIEEARELLAKVVGELPTSIAFQESHDALAAADAAVGELEEDLAALRALFAPEPRGWVYTLSHSETRGAVFSASPLDPGPALREHLLTPRSAVTFTSATLAADDDFSYFGSQVGLEPGEAETLQLESPFDLENRLATLVAGYGVDPRGHGYERYLGDTIGELVTTVRRKTLVLFTAYETLQRVEASLRQRPGLDDMQILAQSREVSRAQLIDRFREAQHAVLLGTATFWHGVDFPGRELEILVVTRLPFPVPSDPRVEAIAEELALEGRSSFQEHALPEVLLKLRQGIGRLIRRSSDRGVCVVLDPRLIRAKYGQRLSAAFPTRPQIAATQQELVTRVRDWFGEAAAEKGDSR